MTVVQRCMCSAPLTRDSVRHSSVTAASSFQDKLPCHTQLASSTLLAIRQNGELRSILLPSLHLDAPDTVIQHWSFQLIAPCFDLGTDVSCFDTCRLADYPCEGALCWVRVTPAIDVVVEDSLDLYHWWLAQQHLPPGSRWFKPAVWQCKLTLGIDAVALLEAFEQGLQQVVQGNGSRAGLC